MGDIRTAMTREAETGVRALSTSLVEVDTALALLGPLQIEGSAHLSIDYAEVLEESGLLADLLGVTAAAAELADGGFSTGGSWLMAEQRRLTGLLTGSLEDGVGCGGTSADVRAHFELKAFLEAGIDPDSWDPSAGLDANDEIVSLVYEYYGDLYQSDPDTYWWAGMAALIGPSFYGGFRDLETFADLSGMAANVANASEMIPGLPGIPGVPDGTDVAAMSAEAMEGELRWYQTGLLSMQKEIFLDMATAHEAYRCGGMAAIEALFADDPYFYGPETIEAWQQIDDGRTTGDQTLIAQGNETLLYREQRYIIDDDYQRMRDRPITGEVTTYAMTAIGAPSVPGARSYPEVFPYEFDVTQRVVGTPESIPIIPFIWNQDVPNVGVDATVTVTTPLPDGNIAGFDDRWALIQTDTLPTYIDLAANHPDVIDAQIEIPVGERASDYQIDERAGEIIDWARSGWDLDFDLDLEAGW